MKKIAFYNFIGLLIISQTIFSQNSNNSLKTKLLEKEILTFSSSKEFKNASLGFYLVDMKTGEEIAKLNPDMALQPGSTMKLVTTAAALEILGSAYRFNTTIEYDGYIDPQKQVLNGNIFIKGGGDPTLGSRFFYDSAYVMRWVDAIKKAGIKKINGCIIGDASIYSYDILPQTWSWEDMGNYFGAGACGLSVLDNSYSIYMRTGKNVGDSTWITEIKPIIPGLDFDNTVKSSNTYEDESFIFGAPYTYFRTIRGELPKGQESFTVKGSVPDPPLLAAFELQMALINNGISVARPSTTVRMQIVYGKYKKTKRYEIYKNYSPRLSEIVAKTNIYSVNLFAEHMLNHIGLTLDSVGDTNTGAKALRNFWLSKGMDVDGMADFDGCGLSRYNTLTPKQLVYVLNYMKNKSKYFSDFYNSLAISGRTGTLAGICQGTIAEGRIHGKSGTIRAVKCYTGYVTTITGRELAFAMMINNYNGREYAATKRMELLMVAMAGLNL